jgi:hypothetical protein
MGDRHVPTRNMPLSRFPVPLRIGIPLGLALCSITGGVTVEAQEERYLYNLNQPRGAVGPATKLKADCEPNPSDGSVTCDTQIENSPSDTPAKLQYQPFQN